MARRGIGSPGIPMRDRGIPLARPVEEEDDVTASEAATYAFCAKAWHLERVRGVAPSRDSQERRAAGVTRHEAHGARVEEFRRIGPRLVRWTAALFVLAAVLLVLAVLALRTAGR